LLFPWSRGLSIGVREGEGLVYDSYPYLIKDHCGICVRACAKVCRWWLFLVPFKELFIAVNTKGVLCEYEHSYYKGHSRWKMEGHVPPKSYQHTDTWETGCCG